MTIKNIEVLAWLKTLFPEITKWSNGAQNKNEPEIVTLYSRVNGLVQPMAIGGPSYGVRSLSLLVHWGKYATPAEEVANLIFERLQMSKDSEVVIGGKRCWHIARTEPQPLGRDSNGFFEYSVDFEIYYRK